MLHILRTLLAVGILVASIPFPAGAADELSDNPMYGAWASHKVGASSTVVEKTTYGDEKNADEKVVTYTLLSVSPEKVVVRAVVLDKEILGTVESSPTKHTYPAKLKKSYLAVAAPELAAKSGEETIMWKGKELACKTLTGSYKKDGETVEFKAWMSETVPGGVVKRTRTTKQKDESITTTITLQSHKAGK
jgi:hypothetical protein